MVIRPELRGLPATNFQQRHEAILEGEKAGFAAIARVRDAIAALVKQTGSIEAAAGKLGISDLNPDSADHEF